MCIGDRANPAPAAYALIAAQAAGGGDLAGYVTAISRALWAEGRDISDDAVIGAALAGAGYDPAVADRGMLMAAETYAANLDVYKRQAFIWCSAPGATPASRASAPTGPPSARFGMRTTGNFIDRLLAFRRRNDPTGDPDTGCKDGKARGQIHDVMPAMGQCCRNHRKACQSQRREKQRAEAEPSHHQRHDDVI